MSNQETPPQLTPLWPWRPISERPEVKKGAIRELYFNRRISGDFIPNTNHIFSATVTHWLYDDEIPRPPRAVCQYKGGSFWHVVFEGMDIIVKISLTGSGFFVTGDDECHNFKEADFIKEVKL
jgi:hypothetical protein